MPGMPTTLRLARASRTTPTAAKAKTGLFPSSNTHRHQCLRASVRRNSAVPTLILTKETDTQGQYMHIPPSRYPSHGHSHHRDPSYPPLSPVMGYAGSAPEYAQSNAYASQSMPPTNFIPTPSDLAQQAQAQSQSQYASYPISPSPHASRHPRHTRAPSSSSSPGITRPRSGSHRQASSEPATERYACNYCSKSFSRSHDRKRHHVGQHLDAQARPVCPNCRKDFSR